MAQRTKNIILVCCFGMLVLIAYKFAFSKTIVARNELNTLKDEAVAFDNMHMKSSSLKQREMYHDSLLTKYQLKGNSIQNSMLRTINSYSDSMDIKVNDFIEPHRIEQNGLKVSTYQFTLEGNYNSIIALIHQLEQNTKFGEIISLGFEKKKNFKTGKFYLQAQVLLRSFG